MNRHYEQVREFHKACGIDMPETPTLLGKGPLITNNWLTGSMYELTTHIKQVSKAEYDGEDIGGEVAKRISYMMEELTEFAAADQIEDQADALIDLIYFALGTFTLMGLKPERIFDEVQAANMRKVVDGKVIRDEQGKIRKPDGWFGPEERIREEIERQRDGVNNNVWP